MGINIIDFIPSGAVNAIPMKQLSLRAGLTDRETRRAILNARAAGEPVCSSVDGDGGGYYLPDSPKEAEPYIREQRARIKSAQAALKAVVDYVSGTVSGNDNAL